jgi:addiction module HigA family antidote
VYLSKELHHNIGDKLNAALGALETHNPALEGVVQHVDFNRQVGRTRVPDAILRALIQHFNRYRLRNEDFEFPDLLGAAYEYLIYQFADSAGKKGGEFYTPRDVVRLMVQILKPRSGMRVYDPCVGSGGMLILSRQYVEESGGDPRDLALYGQDNNGGVWAICKMNMILHGIPGASIANDDTLLTPAYVEGGELVRFDRVLANPPFSQNYSTDGMLFKERFPYSFCPETGKKADLMFAQHMLAVLREGGMLATVMPHGVLFRGGAEQKIRTGFINNDVLARVAKNSRQEDVVSRLGLYVEQADPVANPSGPLFALDFPLFREAALARISSLSVEAIQQLTAHRPRPEFIVRALTIYEAVGNFDLANYHARTIILPLASSMQLAHLERVLHIAATNSQVLYSNQLPAVLQAIRADSQIPASEFQGLLLRFALQHRHEDRALVALFDEQHFRLLLEALFTHEGGRAGAPAMSETLQPARAVSPGEIIEMELEARDWSQRDLAEIMGRPPQAISEIIRGVKQITPETALELAQAFNTSPEVWVNLEASYRLQIARRRGGDGGAGIATRSKLYSLLPVADMVRRGWLRATDAAEELEREVRDLLGGDPEARIAAVSFRHSEARGPEHGAQVAWIARVRQLAARQDVPAFDRDRLANAIPAVRQLAATPEQVAAVPPLLQSLGVRFAIVPPLPKTYIDGVLCDAGSAPIIGLTLRYDRIDSFWFTLMHELAHLVLGHDALHLDNLDDKEQRRDAQEIAANTTARAWLLDQDAITAWVARTRPYFSRQKIERFATAQHIHPGVLLGQLMFDETVDYKHLRVLLVKVRVYLKDWSDAAYNGR